MKQRQIHSCTIEKPAIFKKKLLAFYASEKHLIYLESNHGNLKNDTYSALIAVGAIDYIKCDSGNAFERLEVFRKEYQDWMFGFLGYDLKNELEQLKSIHEDVTEFPDLYFFVPELVFEFTDSQVKIHSYITSQPAANRVIENIKNSNVPVDANFPEQGLLIARDSKTAYLEKAQNFLDHIHRGDIYEANFCTQFYAREASLNPQQAFYDLNDISEPPFAVYARLGSYHIMSASPERYLKKIGKQLISQPIKGTAKRSFHIIEDDIFKDQLYHDPKERSENVMIVDLVRNDLSKTAVKGSVKVEELFGIYTFKQVHQMISTVVSELDEKYTAIDAIKSTFPMGSMTGAPKISAMEIIEQNESFKRGLYSGAIGYFTPDDDFDFNVVIRTILYNQEMNTLSFSVGSAITAAASPEKEYEECLLKARALFEVLAKQGFEFEEKV